MHIGLFGGIGPAATDFYYRRLISVFAARNAQFDLTVVHVPTALYLGNVTNRRTAEQIALYTMLANRLAAAGAECLAIPSAAGHFCIEEFKAVSPVAVIDMLPEVNRAIEQAGYRRVGIIGARSAMETRLFGGIRSADVVLPQGQELDDVHKAYVDMAVTGVVTQAQRAIFAKACKRLIDEGGAQAIVLGGTDLVLAFDGKTEDFPVIDCAAIHADAIAALALG
ncbi:MAG: aspartate/glutamate racemase family protein [Hyphomicrobiales bacterium]